MSAEGSLRQWLPTSKHRSRRLYGGIKKGDKKGARARSRGERRPPGLRSGFELTKPFFLLPSFKRGPVLIDRSYIPLDRAASRPRRSLQKVGTISVTSVHEFFPTTVHIAWINERGCRRKGRQTGVGGGRDGEGVVANTHAPNRECKVGGGVDSEKRER